MKIKYYKNNSVTKYKKLKVEQDIYKYYLQINKNSLNKNNLQC